MKIAFCDFWDGFLPANNFFLDLFKSVNNKIELSSVSSCDILVYSCFGKTHKTVNNSKIKKIFYTGENIRPDFKDCNFSFTFDIDPYNNKNFRLPLWMLYIDWFNKFNYNNPRYALPYDRLFNNVYYNTPKELFCSTVFSSPRENRFEIIKKLKSYKNVDCFGKPFGNWTYGEDIKYKTISNYKFNICFENTLHPGYYTEKIFHAKTAGCIPIYWGDNNVSIDFNPKSFINLNSYSNIDELVTYVIEVDNNAKLYKSILNEPFFTHKPSLDGIKDFIKNIIL